MEPISLSSIFLVTYLLLGLMVFPSMEKEQLSTVINASAMPSVAASFDVFISNVFLVSHILRRKFVRNVTHFAEKNEGQGKKNTFLREEESDVDICFVESKSL